MGSIFGDEGEGGSHARGGGAAPDEGEENSGGLKRDTRKTEKRETNCIDLHLILIFFFSFLFFPRMPALADNLGLYTG